jgi:hypothetical protein
MLRKEARNDFLHQCYKTYLHWRIEGALDPPIQFPLITLSKSIPKPTQLKFYYILGAFIILQHKLHEPCNLQQLFWLIFNV